ncbi:MAG TPA: FAD-dependent oxidoreductase, partial [Burkholderiaceae bacterium]|nr:FAD-dependent oxidoreductase [Burkholderiaceae bacterium]
IVAGGGYIGMEFACVLQRLGVPTTVVMRAELPLRGFDEDLRLRLLRELQRRGMQFVTGHEVKRVERSADGYAVALDDGRQLRAELLLNATGRRPNSAGLGLQQVGVEVDPVGAVLTDENCRTRIPSVYAIGDITHRRNLTPVAIAEGRAVVDTLFGGTPRSVDLSTVATAVFTLPPIGTVGMSEAAARKLGVALKIYETEFRPMRSAFAGSPERTYMKLVVAAETDRVLGVHMLGPDAPEIVQSLAVALSCGATKADFDRTIAVHPTAAEEFVLMREPARR